MFSDQTIWYNIALTDGLGPATIQKIWNHLTELRSGPEILLGRSAESLNTEFGLSLRIANNLFTQLENPFDIPNFDPPLALLFPGDEYFPNERFNSAVPPLPGMLWALGDLRLLNHKGLTIAIAGSRDAHEMAVEATCTLAREASDRGNLIISGLAQGIDSAAHEGALIGKTGTIGVMASGVNSHAGFVPSDESDAICLISQFMPGEPWSGPRAMQRNSVIAGMSDRVVIAAAGLTGGSWEMAQLCLKRNKTVYVMNFDKEIAPGNHLLIRAGARPLELEALDRCWLDEVVDEGPLKLF